VGHDESSECTDIENFRASIDSLTQYGTVIFVQSRRQTPTLYQAAAGRQGKFSSGDTAGFSLIMKQSTTRQIPRFIPGQPTHLIDRQDTAEHGFQY